MTPLEPVYRYRASCERVIDADTYVLRVDLGLRCAVTINGRLRGVDAPELRTPEGDAAKVFAMTLLPPSAPLIVQTFHDRQSFARWIVDLWLPDGTPVADALVQAGHAQPVP